jgi:hypothetical protein
MDRPQHWPGHVVGVHLVAAHYEQGRAFIRCARIGKQAIDAEQTVVGVMMGFTAGAMHQLVEAAVQDEIRR